MRRSLIPILIPNPTTHIIPRVWIYGPDQRKFYHSKIQFQILNTQKNKTEKMETEEK